LKAEAKTAVSDIHRRALQVACLTLSSAKIEI